MLKKVLLLINLFLPIKKKSIMFCSFYGQYNDNPKYICDEFHKRHSDYRIYWVISEKCHEEIPEYIIKIKPFSSHYYKLICRASIIVDNHFSCRSNEFNKNNLLLAFLSHVYSIKRKKQFVLSTWHGTALKRIEVTPNHVFITNTDVLVLGNELLKKEIEDGFKYPFNIRLIGSARNDILFNKKSDYIKKLKLKLSLPLNKRIIMYAPTFRGIEENYGLDIFQSINFQGIVDLFAKKYGEAFCIVVRVHHIVLPKMLNNPHLFYFNEAIINGNLGDDMNEYLNCSDVLITDYSSNMFDFLITQRPCFIYAPDFDDYKNNKRGFSFNSTEIPFSVSKNFNELKDNIIAFNHNEYMLRAKKFMTKCRFCEDGLASKRTVDIIDDFILNGKQEITDEKKN